MWWFDVSSGLAGCHRDPARSAVRKIPFTPKTITHSHMNTLQTKIPWQYCELVLQTSHRDARSAKQRSAQLATPLLTTDLYLRFSL